MIAAMRVNRGPARGTLRLPALLAAAAASLPCAAALAQDRFEIQVYDADTAAPGTTGVESHINVVASGTQQGSAEGELPTDHVTHIALEPHLGVARWCEIGGYLQAALRPDGSMDYAGVKLRFKARLPRRYGRDLIGLALNVELSIVPRTYESSVYGSEVRPIVDLRWRRLYASVNPIIGFDLAGAQAGLPQLQPAAKLAVSMTTALALGAEYYGGYGPVTGLLPAAEQTHHLFAVLDYLHHIGGRLDLGVNFGVGYNLAGAGDQWVVKAIIGIGQQEGATTTSGARSGPAAEPAPRVRAPLPPGPAPAPAWPPEGG